MEDNYAIKLLKIEKQNLEKKLDDLNYLEQIGEKFNEKMKPVYQKQLSDIDFAIQSILNNK